MKTMISTFVTLTIFATIVIENQAAVVGPYGYYNREGNYISNYASKYSQYTTNCCIIPTCDDSGHCYETLSCGYICTQGRHRPANVYGSTPGYTMKEYYTKQDCHFGECKTYKFLCENCPSPKEYDFSIYTVRSDCKNCYY